MPMIGGQQQQPLDLMDMLRMAIQFMMYRQQMALAEKQYQLSEKQTRLREREVKLEEERAVREKELLPLTKKGMQLDNIKKFQEILGRTVETIRGLSPEQKSAAIPLLLDSLKSVGLEDVVGPEGTASLEKLGQLLSKPGSVEIAALVTQAVNDRFGANITGTAKERLIGQTALFFADPEYTAKMWQEEAARHKAELDPRMLELAKKGNIQAALSVAAQANGVKTYATQEDMRAALHEARAAWLWTEGLTSLGVPPEQAKKLGPLVAYTASHMDVSGEGSGLITRLLSQAHGLQGIEPQLITAMSGAVDKLNKAIEARNDVLKELIPVKGQADLDKFLEVAFSGSEPNRLVGQVGPKQFTLTVRESDFSSPQAMQAFIARLGSANEAVMNAAYALHQTTNGAFNNLPLTAIEVVPGKEEGTLTVRLSKTMAVTNANGETAEVPFTVGMLGASYNQQGMMGAAATAQLQQNAPKSPMSWQMKPQTVPTEPPSAPKPAAVPQQQQAPQAGFSPTTGFTLPGVTQAPSAQPPIPYAPIDPKAELEKALSSIKPGATPEDTQVAVKQRVLALGQQLLGTPVDPSTVTVTRPNKNNRVLVHAPWLVDEKGNPVFQSFYLGTLNPSKQQGQ